MDRLYATRYFVLSGDNHYVTTRTAYDVTREQAEERYRKNVALGKPDVVCEGLIFEIKRTEKNGHVFDRLTPTKPVELYNPAIEDRVLFFDPDAVSVFQPAYSAQASYSPSLRLDACLMPAWLMIVDLVVPSRVVQKDIIAFPFNTSAEKMRDYLCSQREIPDCTRIHDGRVTLVTVKSEWLESRLESGFPVSLKERLTDHANQRTLNRLVSLGYNGKQKTMAVPTPDRFLAYQEKVGDLSSLSVWQKICRLFAS